MSLRAPIDSVRSTSGGTLVEAMIAASLAAMVLGALATSSSICMGLVRAQRETVASNLLLQERLEQMRAGGWRQVTNPAALRDEVLGSLSSQERLLSNVRQQITVSPYPPSSGSTPLKVEKKGSTVSVLSQPLSNQSLSTRLAVRVDLRVEWISRQNQRTRSRETSTIISLGGLLR